MRTKRSSVGAPDIGRVLARIAGERDVSLSSVATGFDKSTISRVCTGVRGVTPEMLHRIADALDASHGERAELLIAAGYLPPAEASMDTMRDLGTIARALKDPNVSAESRESIRLAIRNLIVGAAAGGE